MYGSTPTPAAAEELLQRHEMKKRSFCNAIYSALEKGRGKYHNVFIHDPANYGKSFMVSPLKVIYQAFSNPITGSIALIGAEEAEIHIFILLHEKLLQFHWLRAVVFQLNLKYLHV